MVSESIEKSKSVSPAKCLKKKALRKASKNFAKSKDNCLFIRYRHDKLPARDEVRLLHPNIIDVRFPRQKTAKYYTYNIYTIKLAYKSKYLCRFCHLEFENCESAIEALRKIKKTHKEELSVIQYIGKRRTQSLSALASKIKSGVQPEKNSGVQSENDSGDEDSEEETLNTEEEVDQSVHQEDVQPCAWYISLIKC
jgi:hypothetical protein